MGEGEDGGGPRVLGSSPDWLSKEHGPQETPACRREEHVLLLLLTLNYMKGGRLQSKHTKVEDSREGFLPIKPNHP
jgi:hypothetical protein